MGSSRATRWIGSLSTSSSVRLRLFGFPYAGGGASIYRQWPRFLSPNLEMCPIQLPGREERFSEPAVKSMPEVVEELSKQIPDFFDLPFAFFGHSMGALVAFELTRALRRSGGRLPLHLFVSGCRAPNLPDPKRPLHDLPESEFRSELRKLEGTPEGVLANDELMRLLSPVLRADFEICETYTYTKEEPLAVPISVFGSFDDREATGDELEAWRNHTLDYRPLRMFEGNHFFLHRNSTALVQAIHEDLGGSLMGSEGDIVTP